jgi:hypothetical protein
MPKYERRALPGNNPVQIDNHAAATLQYIRASMESASSLALPGSAGIAMGLVGLLAALFSSAPSLHHLWLPIWMVAALMATVLGGSLVLRPSELHELPLIGAPITKFALCLLPSIFGGAVMTAVDWTYGNLHAIPGTWLLLYGCALVAASVATTRTIGLMGASFIALGLIAFALPDDLQMLALGVGFGGLHILFGFLIGRMGHGRQI